MTCSGVYTALITPFDFKGELDEPGLRALIRRQIDSAIDGLLALGTTAETQTLQYEEQKRILSIFQEEKQHLPLMVGCGSSSTLQTIKNIELASAMGATSALIITPYYNKPTQEGLYCHYASISQNSSLPIVLYHNPSRTGVHLSIETLKRLLELPNIIGIKESSGNLSYSANIFAAFKKLRPEFTLICGDDLLALPLLAIGAEGVISGGANLIPVQITSLVRMIKCGDLEEARALNFRLFPLFQALTLESNPIPLKAALKMCQLPGGDPRLPLTPLSFSFLPELEDALQNTQLLAAK